jgi:hypothetical protein
MLKWLVGLKVVVCENCRLCMFSMPDFIASSLCHQNEMPNEA